MISNMSQRELACEIERSLIDCCRYCLARSEGTVLHDGDEVMWFQSGVRFPLYNGIYRPRLQGDIEAQLTALLTPFRTERIPLVVCVGPLSEGIALQGPLKKQGLWKVATIPGMAMSLDSISFDPSAWPGLRIEEVCDEESLRAWVEVQNTGFEFPRFVAEATYRMTSAVLSCSNPTGVKLFLGRYHGIPVATSMSVQGPRVVGIYNVTCLPEARHRGIGTAMTTFPLWMAKTDGYHVGVLHATPMSESLYRKMGFETYCTLDNYLYAPFSSLLGLALGGMVRKVGSWWRGWSRTRQFETSLHPA